jgi:hypothetical protein
MKAGRTNINAPSDLISDALPFGQLRYTEMPDAFD